MDHLEFAAISRAHAALGTIFTSDTNHRHRAKAFVEIAFAMLKSQKTDIAIQQLRKSSNPLVQKAVAHSLGDDVWNGPDASALAASYVASISELSLVDQAMRYARVLPRNLAHVLIASDVVADVVAEGAPKPVRNIGLSAPAVDPIKVAAIIVLSEELARTVGLGLFERELTAAVTRGFNQAFLTQVVDSNTATIAGTGDPLTDLRAGLRAAGPSYGYVVAMPAGDVVDLATRTEALSGMGVRGGTFRPGIEIVAIDDATLMTVIPASRLAIRDFGLEIRSAGHASVDMRDTPESPAQLTSLWQANSLGLLGERQFHVGGDLSGVVIVGGS